MIELDGSMGEGGGQLLRAALALSLATGAPFRISSIRARRAKPGLLRQHLTCVQAAAQLSGAAVEGATLGAQELRFAPEGLRGGHHEFAIGTAGSTLLVAQALLPALLVAPEPSRIVLTGGTHNSGAPPFEFFAQTLLPQLAKCGAHVTARLLRHGFFPAGGGVVEIDVTPARAHVPLALTERGALRSRGAVALRSHLPRSVTATECDTLGRRLQWRSDESGERTVEAHGAGNVMLVTLQHEHVTEVITSFGEKGKPAAQVAAEAAAAVNVWLAGDHAVGSYLADQLLVPLALLAGGTYVTAPLTPHAETAIAVVEQFLPGVTAVRQVSPRRVEVSVRGR